MKADVVFVFRIDTDHVPALTERIQQVVSEFDTLAVKQDQPRSARGLGPEIGSRWAFAHVPEDSAAAFTVWEVREPRGDFSPGRPFQVYMERVDIGGGPRVWTGSVAKHNSDFVPVAG